MSEIILSLLVGIVTTARAHATSYGRGLGPPPPPCGLPPFIDKLPGDAQKKLQEIWQNYKQGDECYNERGETRELLSSLPVGVHKTISKHSPLPPPLTKIPKDVQEHFRAVLDDTTIPCGGKRKKMHELAERILKGDALEEFNDYHNKVEEHMKHIQEMVQRMSSEAKQALDKLFDLHSQEYRILRDLSDSAEEELFDLWKKRRDSFPRQALWMRESQWL